MREMSIPARAFTRWFILLAVAGAPAVAAAQDCNPPPDPYTAAWCTVQNDWGAPLDPLEAIWEPGRNRGTWSELVVGPSGQVTGIKIWPVEILNAFAHGFLAATADYEEGSDEYNAAADAFVSGALLGSIYHEFLHICCNDPSGDASTNPASCAHLVIDYAAHKRLCKEVKACQDALAALGPPPPPPAEDPNEMERIRKKARILALCTEIKFLENKWSDKPIDPDDPNGPTGEEVACECHAAGYECPGPPEGYAGCDLQDENGEPLFELEMPPPGSLPHGDGCYDEDNPDDNVIPPCPHCE